STPMKNTLNLLEELPDGNAPAGSPEEGVPFLFRATPRPRSNGRAVRSKANRERWQGILETTRRTSRRYEPRPRVCITSSFRAICARGPMCDESVTSLAQRQALSLSLTSVSVGG